MKWFDNCVMLVGCVIEVFLLYDYFHNFFDLKIKQRYVRIIFLVICLLLFGLNKMGNANLNLVFFPVLMWIFVSILFESSIGVRIGYFISAYVVMVGVEFLFLILSQTTSDMVAKMGVVPVSDYGWQIIFIKFLNFMVFLILKQTSGKSHSKMGIKLFFAYLCVPVTSLGIMFTVFYSGVDFQGHIMLRVIMTLLLIFMLLGNMMLFYAFQKHTEEISEKARGEIEVYHKNAEIERLEKLTQINEDYRETVHNMTHSLKVIEQIALENNIGSISEIVEELTGKLIQREIQEFSNNKMLNTVLSEYFTRAEKENTEFDVYVEPGCTLGLVKDIDLVSMLGNMLDNAFEAAYKMNPSSVVFRMFMHKNGKMCMVKVVNDYLDEILEKDGKIATTKKEKGIHGIGLTSIEKTAEKYRGNFTHYVENHKFYAVLILPSCGDGYECVVGEYIP